MKLSLLELIILMQLNSGYHLELVKNKPRHKRGGK